MSWSYSGDPSASPLDEVRFLIGDTDDTRKQISNEEITYNLRLVSGGSPPASGNFLAAAYCCNVLVARNSRSVDKSVGDLSISHGQQVKNFQELSASLMRRATLAMVPIYAGGLSISEKDANYADPDRTRSEVRINGMNHSGTENDSTKGP